MSRTRGLFVTGTDTGVGKTLVTAALARALRARGRDVGVLKPSETGVGAEGPLDARALREAADAHEPLERICPQPFALPAAPAVAAEEEGRAVDRQAIHRAFEAVAHAHELVLVEGAGGLRVPLDAELDMAGLAAELALPLLVVARAKLGTINHTLLTLDVARARGLAVAGVVVSHGEGVLSEADARNLTWLRDHLGPDLVGEIPWLAPGREVPTEALDLDRIEGALA